MKKLFKILSIALMATFALSSCMKNDIDDYYDDGADSIENARIKKLLEDQAPILEDYATTNFINPIESDSTGIWYEILQEGQNQSYTYSLQSNGYQLGFVYPTITIRYKAQLMDGTVFAETDSQKNPNGETYSTWSTSTMNYLTYSMIYAFFPRSLSYNGKTYQIHGLTSTGLQKGAKIRFITPSPWGFDDTENVEFKKGETTIKIPKNSPLVYEIELLDIK